MNYGSSTSHLNPFKWVRFDLILMMGDIYINSNLNPLAKFTSSSSRSTEFKDNFPWIMSQIIKKTYQQDNVISYAMKRGILFWAYGKVNGNWDNNIIRTSQWRERNCRTNINVCSTIPFGTLRVSDPSRTVNNLSKVIWSHLKNHNRVHTRIG